MIELYSDLVSMVLPCQAEGRPFAEACHLLQTGGSAHAILVSELSEKMALGLSTLSHEHQVELAPRVQAAQTAIIQQRQKQGIVVPQ